MKKNTLIILFLIMYFCVGCNAEVGFGNNKGTIETPEVKKSKEVNTEESEDKQSVLFNDETHKTIEYESLLFKTSVYHIVSYEDIGETRKYICEIDKSETRPQTRFEIIISNLESESFEDSSDFVDYVLKQYETYNKVTTYENINDKSGITNLYFVSDGNGTKYFVNYNEKWLLVESGYGKLQNMMFGDRQIANYREEKMLIECGKGYIAQVREIKLLNMNQYNYEIMQGRGNSKYTANVIGDAGIYNFKISNSKRERLLELTTQGGELNEIVEFTDVNNDGYIDIKYLKASGARNNIYDLYTWNDEQKQFDKVKCDEILSEVEIYNGYIRNWQKNDYDSGIIQTLIWDGNSLIKESEEDYQLK